MKQGIILLFTVLFVKITEAQQTSFNFDFGTTNAAKGFIAVTPETIYSNQMGYGFDLGSDVVAVNRGGDLLSGDFITSTRPFFFSVKLPEGNYDIKIWLGDSKGISATTVRAECRRLMLENIRTTKGKVTTKKIYCSCKG
jgi:fibronectin type 3 domain-containing protein